MFFSNLLTNFSRAAGVAAPLLRLLHTAESPSGGVARLFRIHPQPDVLLGLPLDVVAQFLVQFALGLRLAQQRPQRGLQSAQHSGLLLKNVWRELFTRASAGAASARVNNSRHISSPCDQASRRINSTAPENRFQVSHSASSCFFPAAVSL